jgi:hypothetical protein
VTVTVRHASDTDFLHAVDFSLTLLPDMRRDWLLHVSCMAGHYIPDVGPPFPRWIVLRAQTRLVSSQVSLFTGFVTAQLELVASTDTTRVQHGSNWSDTSARGSDLDNLLALMSSGLKAFGNATDTGQIAWGVPNGGPYVGFTAPVSTWHPLTFHATGHVLVANTLCGGYSDTGDTNFVQFSPS